MAEPTPQPKKSLSQKTVKKIFLISAFIAVFLAGIFGGIGFEENRQGLDLGSFWKVYSLIQANYVGSLDKNKAVQGATQGLVDSLGDPFSSYLTTAAKNDLTTELSGQFQGIGAELVEKNETVTILAPLAGSPAEKTGLKAGDVIAKVDGKSTEGQSLDQVVGEIRGAKGTAVTLTIVRSNVQQPFDVKITRDDIAVPSVSSKTLAGNVAFLQINQFGNDTVGEVQKAVTDLAASKPKALIIDLRDDPGGFLDDVAPIFGEFAAPSIVVKEKSKSGKITELRSTAIPVLPTTPIYVLVNGGSASAAEILAGALQDYKRATLIGEKTFGKGSVQDVIDLPGNTALRITIAEWLTPNGRTINKTGLQPDVKVTDAKTDSSDPVLAKALELANK
ncbi:MAG TPA: S41 family peptidase [Candidatus Saccharimonadales bacterium]|nr:S41 family peptidase [Candidatus Saccharimonadales bacterium]